MVLLLALSSIGIFFGKVSLYRPPSIDLHFDEEGPVILSPRISKILLSAIIAKTGENQGWNYDDNFRHQAVIGEINIGKQQFIITDEDVMVIEHDRWKMINSDLTKLISTELIRAPKNRTSKELKKFLENVIDKRVGN